MRKHKRFRFQRGFSLIEMLVAMGLTVFIMGAIFEQINRGLQSSGSEQAKLDLFQESREFMDQLSRDLRAAGYPNTRNYSAAPCNDAGGEQNCGEEALPLVSINYDSLWFESSPDGSGAVKVIRYQLVPTGPNCPCLVRSQDDKISGINPLNQPGNTEQLEVQHVLSEGTSGDPIFQAYDVNGVPVPLPQDISNLINTNDNLVNINTVAITLKVRSPQADPLTHQNPTITLMSTVRLNNCSVLFPNTTGTVMGCD